MRGPLLVPVLLLAMALSGCLADSPVAPGQDSGSSSSDSNEVVGKDDEGNPIRAGDDLGELTFDEDGSLNSAVTQPDCANASGSTESHIWTIPRENGDGIFWKAKSLSVTVTPSETAVDLDVILQMNGNELARASETGPDQEDSITVEVFNVPSGDLQIRVMACTSAFMVTYTVEGTADMVATSSDDAGGPCTVVAKNGRYEASRQETYEDTLTGDSGSADISTGAGHISYTGGSGDDYSLIATLKARGDTKELACAKLAEMYVDHDVEDGSSVTLDVHGRVQDNSWNDQQIDLVFNAPSSIDWDSYDASSSAGYVHIDSVTGSDVDVDTSAGYVQVDDVDADSLDASTSAGYVQVRGTRAGDLTLHTSSGYVEAVMAASTSSGDWNIDASAGSIDLTVEETSSIGYDVDASTSAGSVTFDFDEVEETSSSCQYASCHREGRTTGYSGRSIQVTLDLDTSAGSITAGS